MKQIIPIFFTFDDNYSKLMEIAMKSIIEHASHEYQYNIHVLHTNLSEESVKRILAFENDNFKFFFTDITEKLKEISKKLFTRDYYSNTTYFRLFIPNMFPEYNKALYLDSDIVVLDDISKLYNIDIGTNLIGATKDEAVQTIPEFTKYVDKYLDVYHENYFNAGILIMNLNELRKFDFENKFLNLIDQIKFTVAQDQDYLNVICKNRVTYISGVWDKMPFPSDIDENELKLIHYNLTLKPWHYDEIPYEKYFYEYAEKMNLLDYVEQCKKDFDDEKKKQDQLGGEKLIALALELSEVEDTFANLLKNGKIKI